MYNAEVLSKFPVVQHFPFGSLFSWEQDPNAAPVASSVHTANHPISQSTALNAPTTRPTPQEGTTAPWAQAPGSGMVRTAATWARHPPGGDMAPTAAPWAKPTSGAAQSGMPPTRAPWASSSNLPATTAQIPIRGASNHGVPDGPTRAPWADQGN